MQDLEFILTLIVLFKEKKFIIFIKEPVTMIQSSPDLRLAMGSRIPDDHESFLFRLKGVPHNSQVEWYVDNKLKAVTKSSDYLWPMSEGSHTVMARVFTKDHKNRSETPRVTFLVK